MCKWWTVSHYTEQGNWLEITKNQPAIITGQGEGSEQGNEPVICWHRSHLCPVPMCVRQDAALGLVSVE